MYAKTELVKKVQRALDDVYFGNGESVTVGEVVFDRFGFSFKESEKTVPHYWVDVHESDGMVWVEFYGTTGTKPVVVGIPKDTIHI